MASRDLQEYTEALGYSPQPVGRARKGAAPKGATKTKGEVKAPPPSPAETAADTRSWEELEKQARACQACRLSKTRTNVVFGSGDRKAQLMFIGEGPGADEDAQGLPFVGRSGQLLTKMIEAMGLSRDTVFIANVVKCRPPENRNPEDDEIAACANFLKRQVELVNPKVIVTLGNFAAKQTLQTETGITKLRGSLHDHPILKRADGTPVKVMPTYHPAFCLRNPNMKKPVWEDLQIVMKELELKGVGK